MMLKSLDEVKMTVSSAYVMNFACFGVLFTSLGWIGNGKGPIMDPCGTPVYNGKASEKAPWYWIICFPLNK